MDGGYLAGVVFDGRRAADEQKDVAFTYNTLKDTSSVNDFTMLKGAVAEEDDTIVDFHMKLALLHLALYHGHHRHCSGARLRPHYGRIPLAPDASFKAVGQGAAGDF